MCIQEYAMLAAPERSAAAFSIGIPKYKAVAYIRFLRMYEVNTSNESMTQINKVNRAE
jgi:hypothetical protein